MVVAAVIVVIFAVVVVVIITVFFTRGFHEFYFQSDVGVDAMNQETNRLIPD